MARNASDAEDLLQQVFLKAWRRLSTFRSESSFRTWLTRVAVNEALQLYRREQSRPVCQPLGSLDGVAYPGECPHRSLERSEAAKRVRSAVARLPEKYRQVLILRDIEQFSAQETAQYLQYGVPLVKTRLLRARLMLMTALQRPKIRRITISNVPMKRCVRQRDAETDHISKGPTKVVRPDITHGAGIKHSF
jgi:RNA polymerase sigma-70 factor, ECF subfamily